MKLIIHSLKHGNFEVFFDKKDINKIKKYKWFLNKIGDLFYVSAKVKGKRTQFHMHRYLMDFPKGKIVDHIDNNPLNNKRNNLRITNKLGNNRNSKISKNNTTGYKGVVYDKIRKKFTAMITVNYKCVYGGRFNTAIEAAKKYNQLAIKYHGEFARLNEFEVNNKSKIVSKHEEIIQTNTRNTTGYRGVFVYKSEWKTDRNYFAKIVVNKKQIYLGYFTNKKDAAIAYNEGILKYNLPHYFLNEIKND